MGERVRLGIIGSNFISDRIIAASRLEPRIELRALYSRTAARGKEYAVANGIPRVFTSLDEMLASDTVDAVYIASPNSCHCEQTIACLEAGKHVLCEKPLASNAREARSMTSTARRCGRVLMEAMKPTLTPNWNVVRNNLSRVGTVRRWFAAFGKYSSRMDALKAGELPNAFNLALANGAAMDIGVYAIYPMVQLFGRPLSVSANVLMLPSGVDGHGAVNFDYGNMLGTVLYSKMVDMALPWEIEGEQGTIRGNAINAIRQVEFRPRPQLGNLSSERTGCKACEENGEGAHSGVRDRAARERNAADGALSRQSEQSAKPEEWEDVSAVASFEANPYIDYYFELAHFVDLIEVGLVESPINSHEVSIAVMEIVDEIRRQAGIVYPADK